MGMGRIKPKFDVEKELRNFKHVAEEFMSAEAAAEAAAEAVWRCVQH